MDANARAAEGDFNPRSPRGGATIPLHDILIFQCPFQSTLPTRGSDYAPAPPPTSRATISIHAPHEGERLLVIVMVTMALYFNPRSPRGGATLFSRFSIFFNRFQSTLPTRGSDPQKICNNTIANHFNPRSPRGGATLLHTHHHQPHLQFQSTLPTRGSDF